MCSEVTVNSLGNPYSRQLVGKEPGILEPILAAYRVAKADL